MRKFHGTPFSGPRDETALALVGRDALVSIEHPRELPIVAEVCRSFMMDNGAYSAFNSGRAVDFPAYLDWVGEWHRHPAFDSALIPDVIGGSEAENDALVAEWPRELCRAGVPVWHMHEPTERLFRLANEWPTVAIGTSGDWGRPGSKTWWPRMRAALNAVCDEYGRPICRLHGLRMLDPRIFTKIPLASADSTNAGRNCNQLDRFGMYVPPTAGQRAAVIASRIELHNSAPIFQRTLEEFSARFLKASKPIDAAVI